MEIHKCGKCGGEMSKNPHPYAGKPDIYIEVGCQYECIPCLVKSRHWWAIRACELAKRIEELEECLEADSNDLWNVTNAIREVLKGKTWLTYKTNDSINYHSEITELFEDIEKLISNVQHPAQKRFYSLTLDVHKKCRAEMCEKEESETHNSEITKPPPTGSGLIAIERERQMSGEGWDAQHDDAHLPFAMAVAAACYLLDFRASTVLCVGQRHRDYTINDALDLLWPWDGKWWKPTPDNPVRQLVKAGALIAAEIDRLQRGKFNETI